MEGDFPNRPVDERAMAIDRFGRNINYLRISLTDRCNLRCVYCMPEDMTFRPRAELLQDDELLRLVHLCAGLGFRKVRLTGGEPTVRANLVELVRQMAAAPGIEKVAMTTNGLLLDRLARPLAEAGLQRVNISIDTLDPDRFKKLTRWGRVEDVWAGKRQRGVQLHHLREAVDRWRDVYGQRAWLRQLSAGEITREHEDRLMEAIGRYNGRAFPKPTTLLRQFARTYPRDAPGAPIVMGLRPTDGRNQHGESGTCR